MNWETPAYKKAKSRVGSMSIHDLLGWADIAGTAMCKVFYDYSNERDETIRMALLEELATAISTLQAVTETLMEHEKSLIQ